MVLTQNRLQSLMVGREIRFIDVLTQNRLQSPNGWMLNKYCCGFNPVCELVFHETTLLDSTSSVRLLLMHTQSVTRKFRFVNFRFLSFEFFWYYLAQLFLCPTIIFFVVYLRPDGMSFGYINHDVIVGLCSKLFMRSSKYTYLGYGKKSFRLTWGSIHCPFDR